MSTETTPPTQRSTKPARNWLHYAAYFLCTGSLVFIAQNGEPRQIEDAVMAGAIACGAAVSRDWYKARLAPNLAHDSTAAIQLFNEMLHAGRAQANTNAAHLKRVEFLQTDLVEAMTALNNTLRQSPEEIEQALSATSPFPLAGLPVIQMPKPVPAQPPPDVATNGGTHIPDSTTVQQSIQAARPGFDA
ncbi:MAG: hypothetical protein AAFV90_24630 [Cyanobacteria bacterium J06634_5]